MRQSFSYTYRIASVKKKQNNLTLKLDRFENDPQKNRFYFRLYLFLFLLLGLFIVGCLMASVAICIFPLLLAILSLNFFVKGLMNIQISQDNNRLLILERIGFLNLKRLKIKKGGFSSFQLNEQYQLDVVNQFYRKTILQNDQELSKSKVDQNRLYVEMSFSPKVLLELAEVLNQNWSLHLSEDEISAQNATLKQVSITSQARQEIILHEIVEQLQYFKFAPRKKRRDVYVYTFCLIFFTFFIIPSLLSIIRSSEGANSLGAYLLLAVLIIIPIVLMMATRLVPTTQIIQSSDELILLQNNFLGISKNRKRYTKSQIRKTLLNDSGDLIAKGYDGVENILLKQQYEEFGEEKIPTYNYAPKSLIFIKKQINLFWDEKEQQ